MLTILSVFLCYHGAHNVCIEVNVPTPVSFPCGHARLDSMDRYLKENYPHWEYKTFACTPGRAV
jgi:hypothetical protein